MNPAVVITGAGLLSALGNSPAAFYQALCGGRTGFSRLEWQYGARWGGAIQDLAEREHLGERSTRPLNRISRLAVCASELALRDSGWTPEMRERQELALALGTMFCGVHTIGEFDRRALIEGPGHASPMDFANTVINAAAGQTAIWHNLRGINSTIAAGTASGLHAIAYGVELIRTGQCVAVLAGGADELCFESFYGFERSGLLCPTGDLPPAFPIPFDVRRNGFVPAEGAGFVVLEEEGFATRRGGRIRGRITGLGAGFDSSLGQSDELSIRAISRAITGAMEDAGTEPERIGCFSASANGSIVLDRHEAWGMLHALNGRAQTLPVTAVKGALGEAMGASGPAQVVALIESLRQGVLPGIRDLQTDPDLPLRQVAGENRALDAREALVNSVGLDGNCCCLVVQAEPASDERTRGLRHV